MRYQGENVLVLYNTAVNSEVDIGELVVFVQPSNYSYPAMFPASKNSLSVGIKVADNTYENNYHVSFGKYIISDELRGEQNNISSIVYEGIVRIPIKYWVSGQVINEGDFVGVKFFGNPENPTIPCYVPVDTFDADKVLGIALNSSEKDIKGYRYVEILLLNPQITPLA